MWTASLVGEESERPIVHSPYLPELFRLLTDETLGHIDMVASVRFSHGKQEVVIRYKE